MKLLRFSKEEKLRQQSQLNRQQWHYIQNFVNDTQSNKIECRCQLLTWPLVCRELFRPRGWIFNHQKNRMELAAHHFVLPFTPDHQKLYSRSFRWGRFQEVLLVKVVTVTGMRLVAPLMRGERSHVGQFSEVKMSISRLLGECRRQGERALKIELSHTHFRPEFTYYKKGRQFIVTTGLSISDRDFASRLQNTFNLSLLLEGLTPNGLCYQMHFNSKVATTRT